MKASRISTCIIYIMLRCIMLVCMLLQGCHNCPSRHQQQHSRWMSRLCRHGLNVTSRYVQLCAQRTHQPPHLFSVCLTTVHNTLGSSSCINTQQPLIVYKYQHTFQHTMMNQAQTFSAILQRIHQTSWTSVLHMAAVVLSGSRYAGCPTEQQGHCSHSSRRCQSSFSSQTVE